MKSAAVREAPFRAALHPHLEAVIVFCAGTLLVVVGFSDAWRSMAQVWWVDETFNHCYFILPIFAWMVWRQRARLEVLSPVPSPLGLAVLAGCCALWAAGRIANVNVVQHVAVVAMLPGLVIAVFGRQVARKVAFPLGFLFFMVPAGDPLVPVLMDWTADATTVALRAVGIPVFREGLEFALPSGRWSVVEACSGLRYVLAALVLSSLSAYLSFSTLRGRLAFVLAGVVVALVANWARAFMVVVIGHLSQMRFGAGADHVWYGWAFFGLVIFLLLLAGSHLGEVGPEEPRRAEPVADIGRSSQGSGGASTRFGIATLTALAVLIFMSHHAVLSSRTDALRSGFAQGLHTAMDAAPLATSYLQPRFEGSQASAAGIIDKATATEFFAAYFARQSDGREMIAAGNTVVSRSDPRWQILEETDIDLQGERRLLPIKALRLSGPGGERLVWYWYRVGAAATRNHYLVKLLTLWSTTKGECDHSVVAVLVTGMEAGPQAAQIRLRATALALDTAVSRFVAGAP